MGVALGCIILSRYGLSSQMDDMIRLLFGGRWTRVFRWLVNQDGRFGERARQQRFGGPLGGIGSAKGRNDFLPSVAW